MSAYKTERKSNTVSSHGASSSIKNILIIFFLLFSILITPLFLRGQNAEIRFEYLSVADGFPQNTIFCIHKDSRGFMWFGTQQGLSRYDGHNFKTYFYNHKDKQSLSHNYVTSIAEDKQGILWIGTQGGGLNRFNRKTEKFKAYKSENSNMCSNSVTSIIQTNDDRLLIGTDKGLNEFDLKTNNITRCQLGQNIKNENTKQEEGQRINTIYRGRAGAIWVGTNEGLYKCNREKKNFSEIECNINSGESSPQKIRAFYEEKNNIFWIGTEAGLYKFKLEGKTLIQDSSINKQTKELSDKQITSINRDLEGRLWVGTLGDGLYILDPSETEFKAYRNSPYDRESLSHNEVMSLYEDKDSRLVWIGTNGGGINIFDPLGKKFKLHNIDGSNDIMAICESKDGGVWVGTFGGGLKKFVPKENKFINYEILSDNANKDRISTIYEEKTGKVWVGTSGAGLFESVKGTKRFRQYEDTHLKKDTKISPILRDHLGVLWVGTLGNGLIRLDKGSNDSTKYVNIKGDKNSLSDNAIYSILEDSHNVLWIGTGGGGLNVFDRQNETFFHHLPSAKESSISHNFIMVIYEGTSPDLLWIGTNGGGLNKFDKRTGEFTAYTTEDGLPNNVIYGILEDDNGCLWISTNKGLSRFHPETKEIKNYSVRDGLQGYEFNARVACKIKKTGELFFGGIKGLNSFFPNDMGKKVRTGSPPIVITSFKKYNKEVQLPRSISESDELELSYEDKSVSFEFAALSFTDPSSNQYAYRLEPVDKEWIYLGNKHNIDLINLKPGEYTFKVKGSNNDGVWNKTGVSLKINVEPPFWQNRWFVTFSILFLGSLIFYFVRKRIRNIEKKRKDLSETNFLLKKEINERKKAEELYRTLVETSPDAIWLSDVETEKSFMANQRAVNLLGYSSEKEMRDEIENIFDVFSPNDRNRAKKNAEIIKECGFKRSTEYTFLSKDGELIDVEMNTSLIRDAEQKPRYFLSIIRDIRERKEAERKKQLEREKMVQIDKMVSLGSLVSGIGHELNTPLASIKMNADSFAKVWKDVIPVLDQHYEKNRDFSLAKVPYALSKPRFQDLIDGFIESGQRIERIIYTLKDFSRPGDASSMQLININQVIKSSIELIDNMIRKSTNHFSFNPGGNLPSFQGNFQRLEQVFINLIQNACQALSEKTKKIEVETIYQKKNKQIVVKVKDEGKGIAEKDKSHIMDLFYTTKRDSGGTGIGLAISLQIIREHGGRINVESEVDQGTIVIIKFPV